MQINVDCLANSLISCVDEGYKFFNNDSKTNSTSDTQADPRAIESIPADVRMISGCEDRQTSADVSNVSSFGLPDVAGRSGGACTSALLKVLYNEKRAPSETQTFSQVLMEMRTILKSKNFTQVPQLSASRPLDIQHEFKLVPDNFNGTRRAVMIGINYQGQQGELSGCHNDAKNMCDYLVNVHQFSNSNITMLLDDGCHKSPTRSNILKAFQDLVKQSQSGDACFIHYSGHGGKLKDDNGDEDDGYDETLIPLDFQSAGQIRDDELFVTLIGAMASGVTLTCLMDCCHSGTILDLPYLFKADGSSDGMTLQEGFNFSQLLQLASLISNISNLSDLVNAGKKLSAMFR